jgi:hypothetical protein
VLAIICPIVHMKWQVFIAVIPTAGGPFFYIGEPKIQDEFLSSLFLFLSSSFSPHVLQFPAAFRNFYKYSLTQMQLEILTSLVTRSSIFWDITSCSEAACFIWFIACPVLRPRSWSEPVLPKQRYIWDERTLNLYPQEGSWYSFLLETESTPGP